MIAIENAGENSFVLLQVEGRRVALPAGLVAELAPPVRLHTFPHTTPFVAGVIVRRGRIVPVYEVGLVLGGKRTSSQQFYLIARRLVGGTTEFGAIPVNGECELATGDMQPPGTDRPAYVAGTLTIGDDSLDVISLDAFAASHSPESGVTRDAETRS